MSTGRNNSCQTAFDLGFEIAFRTAFQKGKYRQFFNCISSAHKLATSQPAERNILTTVEECLNQELETYQKCLLPLPPIDLTPIEFERKDRCNTLSSLSKIATEYFTKFDQECRITLPKTYSLLNFETISESNSMSPSPSNPTLPVNDKLE